MTTTPHQQPTLGNGKQIMLDALVASIPKGVERCNRDEITVDDFTNSKLMEMGSRNRRVTIHDPEDRYSTIVITPGERPYLLYNDKGPREDGTKGGISRQLSTVFNITAEDGATIIINYNPEGKHNHPLTLGLERTITHLGAEHTGKQENISYPLYGTITLSVLDAKQRRILFTEEHLFNLRESFRPTLPVAGTTSWGFSTIQN